MVLDDYLIVTGEVKKFLEGSDILNRYHRIKGSPTEKKHNIDCSGVRDCNECFSCPNDLVYRLIPHQDDSMDRLSRYLSSIGIDVKKIDEDRVDCNVYNAEFVKSL